MDLVVTQDGAPVLRIALSGRLDAAGAEKIETEFANRVSKAGRGVIVDMSGVSFVGSLGIRLLISNSRSAQRAGHRVVLMGVQPAVAEVGRQRVDVPGEEPQVQEGVAGIGAEMGAEVPDERKGLPEGQDHERDGESRDGSGSRQTEIVAPSGGPGRRAGGSR